MPTAGAAALEPRIATRFLPNSAISRLTVSRSIACR